MLKGIKGYTKNKRPSGGGWNGKIYLDNGKIIFVDYELYCSSSVCYINNEGHITEELHPHSKLASNILLWFADQPVTA